MLCKRCHHEIPEGLQYCGNCGAKVGKAASPLPLILIGAVLVLGLVVGGLMLGGREEEPSVRDHATQPAETQPATESAQTEPAVTESVETEPPVTEAPETQPPQTEPTERFSTIPEELRGNILLDFRDAGACEKMIGDVVVTVIFTDVPEGGWTPEARAALEQGLEEEARIMMEDAVKYDAELNLTFEFLEATTGTCVYGEEDEWADATLSGMGLPPVSQINGVLEEQYGVEAAPVIFYMNVAGRSRACWHNIEGGREFAVLFMEAGAFRHETSHLFGAVDYYYPDLVEEHAQRLFPESLMFTNDVKRVDSMTAYLLGWTDALSPEAEEFLRLTNELTWDTYWAEMGDEYVTGYVTRESDSGIYTGDMVEGLYHGYGTLVFNSGTIYEGEWYAGYMQGYGTMTWEDGGHYEGYWEKSERHGQGTFTWTDGTVYTGEWVNGQRTGYGVITWTSGTVYEGYFKDGKMHGQGTLTYSNGTVKSGQWEEDEFLG